MRSALSVFFTLNISMKLPPRDGAELSAGDHIIISAGTPFGKSGSTNLAFVERI